jgi:hypothetical protein
MKNIYTQEIETKKTIDLPKLLTEMSIVRISLDSTDTLHTIIEGLDNNINMLFKLIKVQDKPGALKQWQTIFNDLNNLPDKYFSVLEKSGEQNQVLIDKFKLDPEVEKHILGIVSESKSGTLNI